MHIFYFISIIRKIKIINKLLLRLLYIPIPTSYSTLEMKIRRFFYLNTIFIINDKNRFKNCN
jgi:hypothetical protein